MRPKRSPYQRGQTTQTHTCVFGIVAKPYSGASLAYEQPSIVFLAWSHRQVCSWRQIGGG